MCDINKYHAKLVELQDYLEYVTTDIEDLLLWEPDLYAAYAAHNGLNVATIKEWYGDAEELFVNALSPEPYLMHKYDAVTAEEVDYYYEKEVFRDGTLYECGGYFFRTE